MADLGDLSIKEELLKWCREVTRGYGNVNIVDFSQKLADGHAFNAKTHKFRPDLIQNFYELKVSDRIHNLDQARESAEKSLDIRELLDIWRLLNFN